MLHIVTAAYRFENFKTIYDSIKMYDDIIWHITKSNERESPELNFIEKEKKINLYNIECKDKEASKKHRYSLSQINSGYFCFLDDDTIFHENMYIKYRECLKNNFIGMVVGEQLTFAGCVRLKASKPIYGRIDTGNVLSHHVCLSECKWPDSHTKGLNVRDFLFWKSVYTYYNNECEIWNHPISHYNKLRVIRNDK